MHKSLKERIKDEIILLTNQQKILSHSFAVIGLIGLCFVLFGIYINSLERTYMELIVSPELDWTIIGSLFVFVCYCFIYFFKFLVFYRIWKLKKEYLSVRHHYAYRYVHPAKNDTSLFINQKLLQELESKGKI